MVIVGRFPHLTNLVQRLHSVTACRAYINAILCEITTSDSARVKSTGPEMAESSVLLSNDVSRLLLGFCSDKDL